MDFSQLEQLGFTKNESLIYLLLAERGRMPAQILAQSCKMPRSTVYSVLASLEGRGLVRPEKLRGATFFRAREPEAISDWLQEDARKIRDRQIVAKSVIQDLKKIFRSGPSSAPKLEFVEGKAKVERFLDENLLRWKECILAKDRSTWGFQDHTFVELFQPWLKRAWKSLHEDGGIAGRILSNRSEVEKKLKGKIRLREVRVLGQAFDFESSMWVMGDYVVLIMTRKAPFYAFVCSSDICMMVRKNR